MRKDLRGQPWFSCGEGLLRGKWREMLGFLDSLVASPHLSASAFHLRADGKSITASPGGLAG